MDYMTLVSKGTIYITTTVKTTNLTCWLAWLLSTAYENHGKGWCMERYDRIETIGSAHDKGII
jgi:hypothetical protein